MDKKEQAAVTGKYYRGIIYFCGMYLNFHSAVKPMLSVY